MLVVYYHAVLQVQILVPASPFVDADIGDSGVDLFFVLSGFVMWITTSTKAISPVEFYWKRIRRIAPLYWSATLAAALAAYLVPSLLRSTVFDPPHILASIFFIPWVNPAPGLQGMIAPIVVPGWTLNYEMYFYLIFGLALLLPQGMRLIGLAAAFTILTISCWLMPFPTSATLFYGSGVVFEFLGGVVIAHCYTSSRRLPPGRGLLLAAAGLCCMLAGNYLFPVVDRLFTMGIPAMVVVYAVTAIDFSKLPPLPLLRKLGDASYSIYITHSFVLAGMRIVYRAVPIGGLKTGLFVITASILASVAIGALVHAIFESPIERYFKRRDQLKGPVGEPIALR